MVDWVTSNLIDQTKSRRQVLKKLKELMLLVDYKGRKKPSKTPKMWTAQEESNLQELFEQFKDSEGKWPFATFSLLPYVVFVFLEQILWVTLSKTWTLPGLKTESSKNYL